MSNMDESPLRPDSHEEEQRQRLYVADMNRLSRKLEIATDALEKIQIKAPHKVSVREAADMAVEMQWYAASALSKVKQQTRETL